MPLNDRQIRNAKPSDKPYKLTDGNGLYLQITPAGGKLWRLKYRFDSKEKLLSIGKYPAVSLVEARQAAENARQMLAQGQDPAAAKQQAKQERQTAIANSFENIAREWHSNRLPGWTPNHAARVWHSLEVDALPTIGRLPITEIKAPLLLEMIRGIEARGVSETASRVLQRVKSVFNYAIQTGRAADNPALSLAGVVVKKKVEHMLALPQQELTEFYRRLMLQKMRPETRLALLLIVLTLVRPGNIRHAEWEEIDRQRKEWAIPAKKMKMREPHIVPLSDWALELLDELHAITGYSRYLFPSSRDPEKPLSENTMIYAMGRMGYRGIATSHGFRSFATDVLNENGFDWDVVERQIAHVEQYKVRAAYHRTSYLPERCKMMQWYSDWLRERYEAAKAMIDIA